MLALRFALGAFEGLEQLVDALLAPSPLLDKHPTDWQHRPQVRARGVDDPWRDPKRLLAKGGFELRGGEATDAVSCEDAREGLLTQPLQAIGRRGHLEQVPQPG